MPAMYDYKGYKLTVRKSQEPPVAVFDVRYPRDPALYKTTSLDKAMRWVEAYIKGEQWAADARLSAVPNPHGKQYTAKQLGVTVYRGPESA